MSFRHCGRGFVAGLRYYFVLQFCVYRQTFLPLERSVDFRAIQLYLDVHIAWRSFPVVLEKRGIIEDLKENYGSPVIIKTIFVSLLKWLRANRKPHAIHWGLKAHQSLQCVTEARLLWCWCNKVLYRWPYAQGFTHGLILSYFQRASLRKLKNELNRQKSLVTLLDFQWE